LANDSTAEGQTMANAPREIRMSRYSARTPSDHFPVEAQVEHGK